ncbi:MAG: hypothetical protein WBZ29_01335 [Methanocella sp.]
MDTRYLLMTCLSLIVGSIFVAPETVRLGISLTEASGLSQALLLAGMVAAVLTVEAEAREKARRDTQKNDK